MPVENVERGHRTRRRNVNRVGQPILGNKTAVIEPERTATLVVTLKKPGRYPYKCTVPGHAQAGMRGVFKAT